MQRRQFLGTVLSLAPSTALGLSRSPVTWRAGTASADITPEPGLWMAGFAARTAPAEGTALPLKAKALALADGDGRRAVLVTVDLLGVTAAMTGRIADEVERRHGLSKAGLLIAASHTHCGPVVDDQLSVAYDLDASQRARIRDYTTRLEARIVALVGEAVQRLEPARLGWARGTADFGANRRVQFLPPGPVDSSVPVLRVERTGGGVMAVVFGYACHNTTLPAQMVRFHGDYAGVAQRELEAQVPGALAMFVAGCGADANPRPRGTVALVEQHGRALAAGVAGAMTNIRPLDARLDTRLTSVDLPFAPPPEHDIWQARTTDADPYVRRHAQLMLERLSRDGQLEPAQRHPVQVWRVGDLALVALGGEVVVDYALRLKREHGAGLWVAAYCNDVSCYVPSLRVLREGGYEGGGAMLYYGRPGPFDETVEDRLVSAANRLLARAR